MRALLVVGLDAKGAVDASRAAGVLRDEKLKWHARRFAALGGVVLVNGLGGALDAALQEWFRKPWTSGLIRKHREWRYNGDAAWGEGYFARFNASSANGAPLVAFSLAAAAELESVSNAERVYFADDSEGCRAGAAISLGAYGGGYVGCFADLNMEPATVSALVALARARARRGHGARGGAAAAFADARGVRERGVSLRSRRRSPRTIRQQQRFERAVQARVRGVRARHNAHHGGVFRVPGARHRAFVPVTAERARRAYYFLRS